MVDGNSESTSLDGEGQLPPMDLKDKEPAKTAEGAVKEPVKGAEGTEVKKADVEAPAPRTYTEEDWNKRQSSVDKQLAKIREESQATAQKLQASIEEANTRAREAEFSTFLRKVENDGGDMDVAKAIIERERKADVKIAEMKKTEAWIRDQSAMLNEAGKGKQANELVKQYGLSEDSLEALLSSETPESMENIALKLYVEKLKIEQKPSMIVDQGKGSGKARDLSDLPPSVALGTLMGESIK